MIISKKVIRIFIYKVIDIENVHYGIYIRTHPLRHADKIGSAESIELANEYVHNIKFNFNLIGIGEHQFIVEEYKEV